MPQPTKIFRVFVSSTFSDMKEERRILQREVFPKLEKYCALNGAKFQAVDLRWGVSEESSLNQKTLDICLNEIQRCQKISPKPNFLILLGDKYGWQPIPPRIPEDEMEAILGICSDRGLLEEWYRKDTNAIPPEYLLQPRADENSVEDTWQKIEQDLREILRETVKKMSFSPEQQLKYFTSATHQEINSGALCADDPEEDPAKHVFAMIRKTDSMPADEAAEGFIDLKDGQQDPYSEEQLEGLKEDLEAKLDQRYHTFNAKWKNGKAILNDEEAFCNQVYTFLQEIIEKQIEEIISPDEIEHEKGLHREFRDKLTQHFTGREYILGKIQDYENDTASKNSLALIGASGSGKSSVMAQAIANAQMELSNAMIVYRFIGTSSRSSNIVSLLQSVCGEIAPAYGETLESLAGEGNEKNLHDINGISEVFRKAMKLGTKEKPLFVFLDALDQLNDSDNARALYWMPQELAEHTKLIVSSLPELEASLSQCTIEQLPLLPPEDAEKILKRWLHSINRTLSSDQNNEVLRKFSHSQLPIYLRLAYEQAKHWCSYTDNNSLNDDVSGIINDFISLLENEHSRDFVQDVICLMLCGRYQGLAENEILEIFAFDDELWNKFLEKTHPEHRSELEEIHSDFKDKKLEGAMKIPIVVWSRLFLDLEPYLTERDADGVPIITFFHRQFNEVLRERYNLN